MQILRSVGVHDGSFHADEVAACALLIIFGLVDEDKIVRTRDPEKLACCEYVCDVGGVYSPEKKRFDHHQSSYSGEWSSAGMILHYLQTIGKIGVEEYAFLNNQLIHGVDEQDNGRCFSPEGFCSFSDIIKIYSPHEESGNDGFFEEAFKKALFFTKDLILCLRDRFSYNQKCRQEVAEAMEKSAGIFMEFKGPIAWLDNFFALGGERHSAAFLIFPSSGQWILRGVPPSLDRRMEVRVPFPDPWAGLLGDQLCEVSGIDGGIFCHKGLFLSVWKDRESCLKALNATLRYRGIKEIV
ncbi:MYG1 family protein [Chlamydiifrater phoenicopteri]|uniref:MYG1 family protein n=1 Tax=Chlamydiifrater phoenicopteri TaxID=2681469 RepID=UPI001BD07B75|nr:MYG1 family protein [Chlamydiifrater phoenicopteri]